MSPMGLGIGLPITKSEVLVVGFVPTDLASLELWLDPGQGITLNGDDVSQWDDQSDNGHSLTQGTAANQPFYDTSAINGEPAVDFDGADEHLSVTSGISNLASQPETSYIVYSSDVVNPGDRAISGKTETNNWLHGPRFASDYSIWTGSQIDSADKVTIGRVVLSMLVQNAGGVEFFIDGTSEGTIANNTTSGPSLWLGANSSGTAENLEGFIGDVVLQSAESSSDEIVNMETYIGDKYAISIA